MRLSDLSINENAIITNVKHNDKVLRRMYDLGFINGSKVKMVLVSPSKYIKAYLIKDSVIALRDTDANKIEVELYD